MWEGGLAEAANSDDEAANSVAMWEGGFAEAANSDDERTRGALPRHNEHAPAAAEAADARAARHAGWKYGPVHRGTFEARRHAAEAAHKAAAKAMADVIERKKKRRRTPPRATTTSARPPVFVSPTACTRQ
jgi:hypothetical protein